MLSIIYYSCKHITVPFNHLFFLDVSNGQLLSLCVKPLKFLFKLKVNLI